MNALQDLSPAQLAHAVRDFKKAAANLPHAAVAFDLLDDALRRAQAGIVFKPVSREFGNETWQIHMASEAPQVYRCNLVGLTAAWLAIRDRGARKVVRAGDLAAPGAKQPSTVIRTAIRETAHQWVLQHTGCPQLAAALLRIEVRDGFVVYEPPASAQRIDTGD